MNQQPAPDAAFLAHLKSAGERVTTPRLTIFRLLARHSPLPMRKLADRAAGDGVDSVTVYRTIALFTRLGFVREIGMGRHRLLELSDDFGEHHHHFWCSQCGAVTDFDNPELEQAIHAASQALGLTVQAHQLEITGLCAACSRLAQSSRNAHNL
ncbi:MAG TPA: Fur family transcriptional regulator [Candidatus Saccharimonadia bacterium]|nr:Fur family transcriptional regulator [Candidatus Saccharimonadia bacterium]